jgi:hypothetical protein
MVEAFLDAFGWVWLSAAVWLLFGVLAASVGSRKGYPGLGCILGLLLGPVGAAIMLLARGTLRECPHCSTLIPRVALMCPHCGEDFRL